LTATWRARLGQVPLGGPIVAPAAPGAKPQRPRPPQRPPVPHGPTGADLVRLCKEQIGDPYVWGGKPSPSIANPHGADCSGLVAWAVRRLGISDFELGTYGQERYCRKHGTMIPVARAAHIQGAIIFRNVPDPAKSHVVVCFGDGVHDVEAAGKKWGIIRGRLTGGRGWTAAALVPGLFYPEVHGTPTPPPLDYDRGPRWPGRYLMRGMRGPDVMQWQEQMLRRGWHVTANGGYDDATERACRLFQREKGLFVDGVVGQHTWSAAWNAPVTP
jgi:peptidoglycan hydrolase-like protein with peptidoglycan-binding domain